MDKLELLYSFILNKPFNGGIMITAIHTFNGDFVLIVADLNDIKYIQNRIQLHNNIKPIFSIFGYTDMKIFFYPFYD